MTVPSWIGLPPCKQQVGLMGRLAGPCQLKKKRFPCQVWSYILLVHTLLGTQLASHHLCPACCRISNLAGCFDASHKQIVISRHVFAVAITALHNASHLCRSCVHHFLIYAHNHIARAVLIFCALFHFSFWYNRNYFTVCTAYLVTYKH